MYSHTHSEKKTTIVDVWCCFARTIYSQCCMLLEANANTLSLLRGRASLGQSLLSADDASPIEQYCLPWKLKLLLCIYFYRYISRPSERERESGRRRDNDTWYVSAAKLLHCFASIFLSTTATVRTDNKLSFCLETFLVVSLVFFYFFFFHGFILCVEANFIYFTIILLSDLHKLEWVWSVAHATLMAFIPFRFFSHSHTLFV